MNQYVLFITISIVSFIFGYMTKSLIKKKKDGAVILEDSQDGERICVRFVLNLDLEELEEKKNIELGIDNRLSQKMQSI